jgi:hypothetical protein
MQMICIHGGGRRAVFLLPTLVTILFAQDPREKATAEALASAMRGQQLTLTRDAEAVLKDQFDQAMPRLEALTARNTPEQRRQLVYFAFGEYLAELRDLQSGGRPPTPGPSPSATIDPSPAKSEGLKIGAAALQRFTFSDFLAKQYPSEAVPKGYLHIVSEPSGAAITINGQSRGYTPRPLVIRPGKHRVSVSSAELNCADDVTIAQDQMVTFRCPRQ